MESRELKPNVQLGSFQEGHWQVQRPSVLRVVRVPVNPHASVPCLGRRATCPNSCLAPFKGNTTEEEIEKTGGARCYLR